jgi:type IV pilus biogenesis protein CpaD/CtpE
MKKLLTLLIIALSIVSCADSKEFTIDNKTVKVEPYGWFDKSQKNDSINYKVNTGNVILSIVFSETIIVPIILTGEELWEPVSKK